MTKITSSYFFGVLYTSKAKGTFNSSFTFADEGPKTIEGKHNHHTHRFWTDNIRRRRRTGHAIDTVGGQRSPFDRIFFV